MNRYQILQERLQGIKELSGAVCHELSQPTQCIYGISELMLLETDDDNLQQQMQLHIIQEQLNIIRSILYKLGEIHQYETKEYFDGVKILDINKSANYLTA